MTSLLLRISFLCLLVFIGGCGDTGQKSDQAMPNPAHPSFVTRQEWESIRSYIPLDLDMGHQLSGVVPHHLVAADLIADYFQLLSQQQPEVLIIVGPNHENQGAPIITGLYDWQTPQGSVRCEEKIVKALINSDLAVRNEEVLSREHSIGSLVPFVRHFLPETRIVPIIFKHGVSLQEVDSLIKGLRDLTDGEAVLLASVDFSHYLTRSEAEVRDKETLSYMENRDLATLFRLGNDHLDSPASLASAFHWAQAGGGGEFILIHNTNSGILMNSEIMETTSYFVLAFGD
ncbi:MAG: AmmeMemoRadiSam system protein B [Syntrophomonadaceae bacterium]|nr:AmmeMemoRadiSam system protein B [Syntrophomonadaceae bacterium]